MDKVGGIVVAVAHLLRCRNDSSVSRLGEDVSADRVIRRGSGGRLNRVI